MVGTAPVAPLGISPPVLVGIVAVAFAAMVPVGWYAMRHFAGASREVEVGEGERAVVVRDGRYRRTLDPGSHTVDPESETFEIRTGPRTVDVTDRSVISRDDERLSVDAAVRFVVTDAEAAFLAVNEHDKRSPTDPGTALVTLAETVVRMVVGDRTVEEATTATDELAAEIRRELDAETEDWGIRIEAVEDVRVDPVG